MVQPWPVVQSIGAAAYGRALRDVSFFVRTDQGDIVRDPLAFAWQVGMGTGGRILIYSLNHKRPQILPW